MMQRHLNLLCQGINACYEKHLFRPAAVIHVHTILHQRQGR